jgi:hypothetical protein
MKASRLFYVLYESKATERARTLLKIALSIDLEQVQRAVAYPDIITNEIIFSVSTCAAALFFALLVPLFLYVVRG